MRTIAVVVLAAAACGGDKVHHLADGGRDAFDAGRDAAVADDAAAARDARPDAATPDAATPDAAVGVASVTVTVRGGVPESGTLVYFVDPDGTAVTTTTDATGTASATITAGASATVVEPESNLGLTFFPGQLYTVEELVPGDDIAIDQFTQFPTLVSFDLQIPALAGAASYQLQSSCGPDLVGDGTIQPGSPQLQQVDCTPAATTIDMVVAAFAADGTLLGSLAALDQDISGGSVTLAGVYAPAVTTQVSLAHVPAVVTGAAITTQLASPRGVIVQASVPATIAGGTASATFPTVAGGALTQIVTFDLAQTTADAQHVVAWGSAATTVALDDATLALADFDAPTFDAADQTFRWTSAGFGDPADGALMRFAVTVPEANYRWDVVSPGDRAIALPKLPADLFDFTIPTFDDITIEGVTTMRTTGGYRAVVANHPWGDSTVNTPPLTATSATGTAVLATM